MLHFAWVLDGIPRNSALNGTQKTQQTRGEKASNVMLFHHQGGGCTAVSACFPLAAFQLPTSYADACLTRPRAGRLIKSGRVFKKPGTVPWGLFEIAWCFLCVVLDRQGPRSCGYFHAKMRGTRRTTKPDRSKLALLRTFVKKRFSCFWGQITHTGETAVWSGWHAISEIGWTSRKVPLGVLLRSTRPSYVRFI